MNCPPWRSYAKDAKRALRPPWNSSTPQMTINLREKHLENGKVEVLIVLADLYSKVGNPQTEIELLRRSVAEGEPSALHNLGFALWNSGQVREGRALLKKAAQQGDKLSPKVLRKIRGKQRHGRRHRPIDGSPSKLITIRRAATRDLRISSDEGWRLIAWISPLQLPRSGLVLESQFHSRLATRLGDWGAACSS
ncbi:hypothetical protein SRABI83_03655 [Arthrobacter sp. Bi83]|jgi:TPR repeat protein|nr:hypothetical protein SRABI83_03655 [Arthrobacter sp. Bi83]